MNYLNPKNHTNQIEREQFDLGLSEGGESSEESESISVQPSFIDS